MDCNELEAASGDLLDGTLDAAARAGAVAHLRGCARCKSLVAELRTLWRDLEKERAELREDEPAAVVPRAELRRRRFGVLMEAYRAGAGPVSARATRCWIAVAASALLLGLAGGWLLPRSAAAPAGEPPRAEPSPPQPQPPAPDAMPRFLLALRERFTDAPPPDPDVLRAIIGEYEAWAAELQRGGHLVLADKLREEGELVLPGRDGGIDSEPLDPTPSADYLSGFFVVRAQDAAAAKELLRDSPHLRYGGTIELREIEPTGR